MPKTLPSLTLVLGGAASGKSTFAETLLREYAGRRVYLATAQAFDAEMSAKVAAHRDARGAAWHTIEEPIAIAPILASASHDRPVLLDCATLWLTNVILADMDVTEACDTLLDALRTCPAPVVIVSNEVGAGIVPDNALSRRFRNAQGRLNQMIAAEADHVFAVMAGLPITLKGPS